MAPRDRQPATKPYKLPDGSYTRIPMNRDRPHPSKLGPKEKSVIYPKRFPLGSKSNPDPNAKKPSPEGKTKTGGGFEGPGKKTPSPKGKTKTGGGFQGPGKKTANRSGELTPRERLRLQRARERVTKRGATPDQRAGFMGNLRDFLQSTNVKQRSKENKQGLTGNERFRLQQSYANNPQAKKELKTKLQNTTYQQRLKASRRKALEDRLKK
jgi:hypothetical protein